MNFSDASNYVDEYCSSEHFYFLNPESLKNAAPELLAQYFQFLNGNYEISSLENALLKMSGLNISPKIKKNIPSLLDQYFEYLSSTGKIPEAVNWQKDIQLIAKGWNQKIRDDGSVKGTTFVHKASTTGRNAPCPCGSGKKFKKCCMLIL